MFIYIQYTYIYIICIYIYLVYLYIMEQENALTPSCILIQYDAVTIFYNTDGMENVQYSRGQSEFNSSFNS